MEDIGHKCGVAAMIDLSGQSNVVPAVAEMLKHLEHRGDAGTGLAWMDESTQLVGRRIATYKSTGQVSEILSLQNLHDHGAYSSMCIGQDRYATNGSNDVCQLQPFEYGDFAFVWNGNIADYEKQRQFLAERGITPRFGGDTEILGCMIGEAMLRAEIKDIRKQFQRALGAIDGAFNPIVMTKDGLVAVRDRHGFHPLVYAHHSSEPLIAIASENTAIHQLPSWSDAEIFHVKPGQLIEVNAKSQQINVHSLWASEPQLCFFETVYFADHRTTIDGISVANVRYETGKILAEMDADRPNTDIVVPVPESAKIAASAYCDKRNLRRVDVIKKNADIGRSFMAFSPEARAEKSTIEI